MRRPFWVGILLVGVFLVPPVVGQEGVDGAPYTAESMWGAKHAVGLDTLYLFHRAPWLEKPSGQGVRVAIIDTGIDLSHPDLADSLACAACWRDFVGDRGGVQRAVPYDDHGHGTHVAGIVAGAGHFQANPLRFYWLTGVRGVAPDAKLLVAKAMRYDGEGDDETVARAIRWAMDPNGDGAPADGAHIINLSLGIEKPTESPARNVVEVGSEVREAILDAVSAGVVIVVSAGNDGASTVTEPGDMAEVITVAATDRDGVVARFSNVGPGLDILAPGVLVSSYPRTLDLFDFAQDGYAGMAGTSMAAPIVAGVVALMMEAEPSLAALGGDVDRSAKVLQIQRVLRETAAPVASGGRAVPQGAGILDAEAAVARVDRGGTAAVDPPALAVVVGLALVMGRVVWSAVRGRRRSDDGFSDDFREFPEQAMAEEPAGGPPKGPA